MRRLMTGCVMVAALFRAAPGEALPILNLLPLAGTAGADPGQTIGWGYERSNDDPTYWLVLNGVVATAPFESVTPNDQIFDFPILAPNTMVTQGWVQGAAGLMSSRGISRRHQGSSTRECSRSPLSCGRATRSSTGCFFNRYRI